MILISTFSTFNVSLMLLNARIKMVISFTLVFDKEGIQTFLKLLFLALIISLLFSRFKNNRSPRSNEQRTDEQSISKDASLKISPPIGSETSVWPGLSVGWSVGWFVGLSVIIS